MARSKWKDFVNPGEKKLLEDLYELHGVATDQLRRDQATLLQIARAFNRMTDREESPSDILRYMINRRKGKDWPCLGDKAKKFEPLSELLSETELEILKNVYISFDVPSDEYLYRPKLARQIANRFNGLTGLSIHPNVLVAIIMAKRKRGLWICIREEFGDIDQVVEG